MNDSKVIAEWARNPRETVRVSLGSFNGRDVIDIRSWYTDKSGALMPGRAGLCVSVRHLPRLAQALCEAVQEAQRLDLLEGATSHEKT